jgi:hypothetical protein
MHPRRLANKKQRNHRSRRRRNQRSRRRRIRRRRLATKKRLRKRRLRKRRRTPSCMLVFPTVRMALYVSDKKNTNRKSIGGQEPGPTLQEVATLCIEEPDFVL